MSALTRPERLLSAMDSGALAYIRADARARRDMLATARGAFADFRAGEGFQRTAARLLTPPMAQAKLRKSATPTYGLTLAPERTLGPRMNLCPSATAGCAAACINTAGKGRLSTVQHARAVRARFVLAHAADAGVLLAQEVLTAITRHGGRVLIRLNVVSDIRWELVIPRAMRALIRAGARFYDYTKWAPRMRSTMRGYALTYSAHERMTDADIRALLADGHSVAVVFATTKATVKAATKAGATWQGARMVDGVSSDDRTRDPRGSVVALAALGDARGDASGFVRPWFA